MEPEYQTVQPPWHHTPGGKIFVLFLGAIVFAVVVFFLFLGYYTWQIRFGDPEKIAEQFEQQFTFATGLPDNTGDIIQNVEDFIRPYNPRFGNPDAPIKILAFKDFECPFCAQMHLVLKDVMERYAPAVDVVFKHIPITVIHPNATVAASAAQCAHDQDRFWEYYDALYTQRALNANALTTYAQNLGLDVQKFTSCVNAQTHTHTINQDISDAVALGVRGTPTYFINNIRIEGVQDVSVFDDIILELLQQSN